jgi:hypothetical protein
MTTKLVRAVKDFTGTLLGGIAVSVLAGNVLICVYVLLCGQGALLGHLPQQVA